ncbi:coiled-coil domain-containing protein, partial [Euroglyphus maynei]
IRAQFLVLKKAVIDEEGKNLEQQQTIKIRDQNIRRLEQEIESLQFRNEQLTKRIGVLQNDLNTKERQNSPLSRRFLSFSSSSSSTTPKDSNDSTRRASTTSSTGGGSNNQQQQPESMDLVDELNMELKMKTEELEQLKQLNSDLKQQQLQETERLEHELKLSGKQMETMEQKMIDHESSLRKLQREKLDLENRHQKIDQEFHKCRLEMENLKIENKNLKQRMGNMEQQLIQKHSKSSEQQANDNIGSMRDHRLSAIRQKRQKHHQPHQQNKFYKDLSKRKEVIEQFTMKLCEFICALSTFRDYMQMGYDTYLVQLEDASKQYSELKIQQWKQQSLSSTITDLNAIEQEISKTSIDIVETFADYVSYLNKTNIYLTIW